MGRRHSAACNAQTYPHYKIEFGAPTSDNGKHTGRMGSAGENGRCEGKSNFRTSQNGGRTLIEFGYK
ncbi:hypothetical protein [Luethyella okanaganae]|uniref:Uncharacterized protein n=1 Tax=Luethyella okanaganae TaxID=69372 RepID=A0ABW1VBH5_9MICO